MSRQQRLFQLPLVGTLLFCLLIGVLLFASRRSAKKDSEDEIVKHTVDTPPEEALEYWTADRMRRAEPAEMPNVDAAGQKKRRPRRRSPRTSRPQHS